MIHSALRDLQGLEHLLAEIGSQALARLLHQAIVCVAVIFQGYGLAVYRGHNPFPLTGPASNSPKNEHDDDGPEQGFDHPGSRVFAHQIKHTSFSPLRAIAAGHALSFRRGAPSHDTTLGPSGSVLTFLFFGPGRIQATFPRTPRQISAGGMIIRSTEAACRPGWSWFPRCWSIKRTDTHTCRLPEAPATSACAREPPAGSAGSRVPWRRIPCRRPPDATGATSSAEISCKDSRRALPAPP